MENTDGDSKRMTAKRKAISQEQTRTTISKNIEQLSNDTKPQTSHQHLVNPQSISVVLPPVSTLLEQVDSTSSYGRTTITRPLSPPTIPQSPVPPTNIFSSGAALSRLLNSSSLETHQMVPLQVFSFSPNYLPQENLNFSNHIPFQIDPTLHQMHGTFIANIPKVHTAEIVSPPRPKRPKNIVTSNISYPTTVAEVPSEKIFYLLEQPNPLQRKSYSSENR